MIGPILLNLLNRYDKLVLPGLGIFTCQHVPASIQFSDRNILPPDRKIEFRFDGQASDYSIFSILDQAFGVNQPNAELMVCHFVKAANEALSQQGNFEISEFGSLVKDLGGDIHFRSVLGIAYNAESFGLPILSAISVESAIRKEIHRETPVIPLRPFGLEEKGHFPSFKEKQKGFRWLPYAAVVTAMAISFSAIIYVSDQTGNFVSEESNKFVQEASIVQVPALTKAPTKIPVELGAEPVHEVEVSREKEVVPIVVPEKSFFVVAGSFKQPGKMEAFHSRLLGKGFESELVPNAENGLTRVTIGKFKDKETAVNFLHSSQNQFDERLWILTQ